jgi:hypothetical protein
LIRWFLLQGLQQQGASVTILPRGPNLQTKDRYCRKNNNICGLN